jgi:hypothetical protein
MQVFETASNAPRDGSSSDLGVLIDHSGALRIVAAEGWTPESLQSHYGARTVYHVRHTPAGVCVDGRGDGVSCTLRASQPVPSRSGLPAGIPLYTVVSQKLLA